MVLKSLSAYVIAAEPSLWREIGSALFADDTQYEYLGTGGSMTSLRMIIVGIFIGLALAAFGAVFNKRVLGDFVRGLLREEALTPETAKTLTELGYLKSSVIRSSVKRGVTLRRVVRCREEEEYLAEIAKKQEEYEEKRRENPSLPKFKAEPFCVKPSEHHFYIPDELKYMADVKFEKRGTTWLGAILFSVILLIVLVVLLLALPKILEILNDWFGMIASATDPTKNMVT